jgi:hypothetical protein
VNLRRNLQARLHVAPAPHAWIGFANEFRVACALPSSRGPASPSSGRFVTSTMRCRAMLPIIHVIRKAAGVANA